MPSVGERRAASFDWRDQRIVKTVGKIPGVAVAGISNVAKWLWKKTY